MKTPTIILIIVSCFSVDALACKSDVDCKGDRICQAGQCTDPNTSSAEPAPSSYESSNSDEGGVLLRADFLGLVTIGLAPTIEFGGSKTGFVRLRLIPLGISSHLLWAYDDDESMGLSFGIAAGMRNYIGGGKMKGLYIGFAGEYIDITVHDTDHDGTYYHSIAVVPEIEVGYAWRFAGGFTVGVGFGAGYGLVISADKVTPEATEDRIDEESDQFMGFFNVDLGFVL